MLRFLLYLLVTHAALAANPTLRVDYQGFTIWLDSTVPYECQPSSTATFSTKNLPNAPVYHRGHLVAANHLDYSEQAMRESFFMTNILPMTQAVNLGAWGKTEKITECYRDRSELLVLGGAIWKSNKEGRANDYFVGSHNIRTPESFWKVIIAGDGSTIAWLIPNDTKALSANLDRYLMTPNALATKTKVKLPEVPKAWRNKKPKTSWPYPPGCSPG